MSGPGHNSDQAYGVAAGELQQIVAQIEQLTAEKKDIQDQIKEVFAHAKGQGFDTAVLRLVIARRKKDKDDLAETEAILDMYEQALATALDI